MASTILAFVGFLALISLVGSIAIILRKLNMGGAAAALIGLFALALALCAAGLSTF